MRRLVSTIATVLAGLLVLFALLAPNEIGRYTPVAFRRIPVEAILTIAHVLVLPARARRPLAVFVGVALGLLAIVKIVDIGFSLTLARPFDLVLDWVLFDSAVSFLTDSVGRVGAVGAVIGIGLVAAALVVLVTLSVLRLTRLALRDRTAANRGVLVFGVAWATLATLGLQIVPTLPVADQSTTALVYNRVLQVQAGLRDQEAFAAEAAVDAYRDTPGDQLLTALRGKEVIVAFVESYGRDAVEDPEFAPEIGALLDAGNQRLAGAGYASRSGFLTSPVAGGGSWLAHATLLSGLWINNQQRYRNLVSSDRLTLGRAFNRADWRTVAAMPAIVQAWPEGQFYGYDKVYAVNNLGYQGPKFGYAPMPDQYTISAFQRAERADPNHAPVMAEFALVSSHAPWRRCPGSSTGTRSVTARYIRGDRGGGRVTRGRLA